MTSIIYQDGSLYRCDFASDAEPVAVKFEDLAGDERTAAINELKNHGFIVVGSTYRQRQPGEYAVLIVGVDDPGSCQEFKDLREARAYLRDRIEYYDGEDAGHSDFTRYTTLGFKLAQIGCTCVEHEPHWAPSWDELDAEVVEEEIVLRASELDHLVQPVIDELKAKEAIYRDTEALVIADNRGKTPIEMAYDALRQEYFDHRQGGRLTVLETVYNCYLGTGTL